METEMGACRGILWCFFFFFPPGCCCPLNPHLLLVHSELGSDFILQVSKETMPAVAASAASCPLACPGHFPGLFCSARTGAGHRLSLGMGN